MLGVEDSVWHRGRSGSGNARLFLLSEKQARTRVCGVPSCSPGLSSAESTSNHVHAIKRLTA
jgi:hypothetical protein